MLRSPTLIPAIAALVAALSLGACLPILEETEEDEFTRALPTADDLTIEVPSDSKADSMGSDGTYATAYEALVGQYSEFHQMTWTTTVGVNWHLAALLDPIKHVVDNIPPTASQDNKRVWKGSKAMDPDEHLLVVEKMDDGHFEFTLLSKRKAPADAPWRVRVAGTYTPNGVPDHGQGSVWVDLDTDLDDSTAGKVLALWSRLGGEHDVTVYYFQVKGEDDPAPRDAVYHYEEETDGSGVFVFGINDTDIDNGKDGRTALEDAVIISRWLWNGSGRADVFASGGDVEADGYEVAIASQCWAADSFVTSFEQWAAKLFAGDNATLIYTSGDLSSCAFEDIGEPNLPSLGEEPEDPELPEEAD